MQFKWSQHPYVIEEDLGKGCFRIKNPTTGLILKKAVNTCRLKKYYQEESSFKDRSSGGNHDSQIEFYQ